MNYTIVESTDPLNADIKYENVLIDNGDGSFESFPVDENNPRYIQWLAEQDEVTE